MGETDFYFIRVLTRPTSDPSDVIRAIGRSPKVPRSYYLPARWLYTHLNRSDYVSWFSDVRRRPAPIGR